MNADVLLNALELPAACRVDKRVPKKLLLEHGAPTTPDKRKINDGIETLTWVAALKPTTIGVPEFRDEDRHYPEAAILRLALREGAKADRLGQLVHRAVPYPVFLLAEGPPLVLSLAHKRWSQNEKEQTVLDGEIAAVEWNPATDSPFEADFLHALALHRQPRKDLHALYQGWIDTLHAVEAARRTGRYAVNAPADNARRRQALIECSRLEGEIDGLRKAAGRENQIARQVELNLKLKRAEAHLADARARL